MSHPSSDTTSVSVRIRRDLYEQVRSGAAAELRTKVGRAALDNPDLPVSFITEALASLAEPREEAMPFEPRGRRQ